MYYFLYSLLLTIHCDSLFMWLLHFFEKILTTFFSSCGKKGVSSFFWGSLGFQWTKRGLKKFRAVLCSQKNQEEDTEISHIPHAPHTNSLLHYQYPSPEWYILFSFSFISHNGTWVTIDEPTLTHHYYPKSILYNRTLH